MRHLSFSAFLVVALASCNGGIDEPEIIMDTPVAAAFTAHIGPVSRAAGTTWGTDDRIGITGTSGTIAYANVEYKIDNQTQTQGSFTAVGEGIFYQTTGNVTFTAYYPFTGTDGTAQTTITGNTRAASQTAAAQPGIDYLWAQATGSYKTPVKFTFDHKMSLLTLTFTAGDGFEDLTDMTAYTVGGLKMDGTFDPATGTATATGTAENLTISDMNLKALILYPQTPASGGVKISAVVDGQTYSCSLPDITELAAGKEYKLEIKVSKTGLSVSEYTINSWTSGGNHKGNATMP